MYLILKLRYIFTQTTNILHFIFLFMYIIRLDYIRLVSPLPHPPQPKNWIFFSTYKYLNLVHISRSKTSKTKKRFQFGRQTMMHEESTIGNSFVPFFLCWFLIHFEYYLCAHMLSSSSSFMFFFFFFFL
jgi:hypothetical protein